MLSCIPGEIKGYYEAYKIGGKLPWKDLIQPTIDLCFNGFKIPKSLATALKSAENSIRNNSELASMYINKSTNSVYRKGDVIRLPKLANTLKLISESNTSDVFYNGALTESIITEMNENGGNVSVEDFKKYAVITHVNRIIVDLDENYRVYVPPPPSSGILVPFIMKIMKGCLFFVENLWYLYIFSIIIKKNCLPSGFNLTNEIFSSEKSQSIFYHRLIESLKHAYSNRIKMGDENFVDLTRVRINNDYGLIK